MHKHPILALGVTIFLSVSCGTAQAEVDASFAATTPIKSSPEARELARKVIDAYGGITKLDNLDRLAYKSEGSFTERSMMSGAANTLPCSLVSRGNKVRIQIDVFGQKLITGFNGKTSWIQQGDEVYPADAKTSKNVREDVEHGLTLLVKFLDKNIPIGIGPSKEIHGAVCPCLILKSADGKPTYFYLDPKTHLVLQSEYYGIDLEQGLPTLKATEYSDYRPCFGTTLPFTLAEFNGSKKSSETNLTSIDLAPDVGDELFEMPVETSLERLREGPVSFPFEYKDNEIIVKAIISGKPPVDMILDTGATQTIIDSSKAKLYGEVKESGLRMTTGSGSIAANYMVLDSLTLGDLTLRKVSAATSALSGFDQLIGSKPVGLIGANILRRFRVTVDFNKHVVTISDPRSNDKLSSGAVVIDTTPALGTAGLVVDGKLDGQALSFLIDSGAAYSNVSQDLVKDIAPPPQLNVGTVLGLDGIKVSIGSVKFKTLKLGNSSFSNVIFTVAPRPVSPAQAGIIANGSLAILGNPFWSHFKVTFDYRNQHIILEQSKEQAAMVDAQDEMARTELRFFKTGDTESAVKRFQALARSYEAHVPGAAAMCIAREAILDPTSFQSLKSAEDILATSFFQRAILMANKCPDTVPLAELYAAAGLVKLRTDSDSALTKESGQLICKAALMAPTDSIVAMALHRVLLQTGKESLAAQVLDQILLFDPSNWDALWARYKQSKEASKPAEVKMVTNQLKRYYSGVPKVDILTATTYSGNNIK